MAFEPNYDKVVSSYIKRVGNFQTQVECKLPASENTEINKVLCTSAKAYVSSYETHNGEVSLKGFVSFCVLYDGTEPQGMEYSAEFTERQNFTELKEGATLILDANVVDIKTSVVSSTEASVVAIVEVTVDMIASEETSVLTSCTGEGVYTKQEDFAYSTFAGEIKNVTEQNFDVEIRNKVGRVLNVCLTASLNSVLPKQDYVTLNGSVFASILYTLDGDSAINCEERKIDFNYEVAANGINENTCLQNYLHALYNDVKVTTNIDEQLSIINVNAPLSYNGYAFNKVEISSVRDIFSCDNYISVDTTSVATLRCGNSECYKDKFSANIIIDDNMPLIDDIVGVCANNFTLASASLRDGELNIEGVVSTTVIYLNKEDNTRNAVEIDSPVALSFKTPYDNLNVSVDVDLVDLSARGKRGNEIDVDGQLFIYANFFGESVECGISLVKLGEQRQEEKAPLLIYIVKPNETMWDVAKNLLISEEELMMQNPNLTLPLTGGEKIRVYRQKIVNF